MKPQNFSRLVLLAALTSLSVGAIGQGAPAKSTAKAASQKSQLSADELRALKAMEESVKEGIEVRVKDIARFRGVRSNQLLGYGIVVGLEGTGDSKKTPFTSTLLANAMKQYGTMVNPNDFGLKNVATVSVTAELPPFASPGNRLDVTVQSIGDAKSLQGGTLLMTTLSSPGRPETTMAVAQGSVSIGGFNASGGGGNSIQKNHVNVGRISGGAFIESVPQYQMVFEGNKLFVELDEGDITTADRLVASVRKQTGYAAAAVDGGTVCVVVPPSENPISAMAKIEKVTVFSDIPALVVVNERTGTITISGNVKLGPAVVARGNLKITITSEPVISQPAPLGQGNTVVTDQTNVEAKEEKAQIGVLAPAATLGDLAKLFQKLKLSASDIIAILDSLKQQGALKARIKVL